MVYHTLCPSTTDLEPPTSSKKKRKFSRSYTYSRPVSTFFHRRNHRIDHTKPIPPGPNDDATPSTSSIHGRFRQRIIIQPVNIRDKSTGLKHDRIPDLDMSELYHWNHLCSQVLQCYFGSGRNDDVVFVSNSPIEHHTKLYYGRYGTIRKDQEGLLEPTASSRDERQRRIVTQLNAKAMYGVRSTVVENNKTFLDNHVRGDNDQTYCKTLIVYVIAAHVSDGSGGDKCCSYIVSHRLCMYLIFILHSCSPKGIKPRGSLMHIYKTHLPMIRR
jgi:hypothetical protein